MGAAVHIFPLCKTAYLNFYVLKLCEVVFEAALNININFMLDCTYICFNVIPY